MRHLAGAGQLAAADLVQDLAGLFLAEVVVLLALVGGEEEQRVAGDLRIHQQCLEAGDQRVAAEGRGIPRHAGGDDPPAVPVDVEGLQIRDRLRERPVEGFFAGGDARARLGPGAEIGARAGDALIESPRGGRMGIRVRARIEPTLGRLFAGERRQLESWLTRRVSRFPHRRSRAHRMHGGQRVQFQRGALVGSEMEREARLAAGDLVGLAQRKEDLAAVEHAVAALVAADDAVGRHQRPEICAARPPPGAAHLELIREITSEFVLDPIVDVADQVVGQGEALDEMLVDQLLAPQVKEVDRVLEDAAEVRAGDGHVHLRGVLGAHLRREHHRRPAGDAEPQLAEEARVLEIRALVARAGGKDVPQPPRHGEEIAALEHQLVGAGGLGQRPEIVVAEQLGCWNGDQCPVHSLQAPAALSCGSSSATSSTSARSIAAALYRRK